jgi:AmmeMemoRadiSam system protein B
MILKKPCLPPGWYPQSAEKIRLFLAECMPRRQAASAALAPHAGWYYSGALAAQSLAALRQDAETVVVIGGHLPGAMPPLLAGEDGASTPLGVLEIDTAFRDMLGKELGAKEDRYQDNTVEVLLPMVKYFFPQARLVWLRLGASLASFDAGGLIARIGASLGRRCAVLGSTDLTHYGAPYGYVPRGLGSGALEWVRSENDAAFIRAVMAGDPKEALLRAEEDRSACSAGAVLGCLGFAQAQGLGPAALLAYGTSADRPVDAGVPDSFVGYASMAWFRPV